MKLLVGFTFLCVMHKVKSLTGLIMFGILKMRLHFHACLTPKLFYKKNSTRRVPFSRPMMLFACLRMMGHGDDGPRDGNDNWMVIASLTSPAKWFILVDFI